MYLSENDLNGIGREIVRSYSTDEFAPVDIEDLLKKMLGISVEDYTLHPGGRILGMFTIDRLCFCSENITAS